MRLSPVLLTTILSCFTIGNIDQPASASESGSAPPDMRKSTIETPTKSLLTLPVFPGQPASRFAGFREKAQSVPADARKYRIEKATKNLISQPVHFASPFDMRKSAIESPLKDVVSEKSAPEPTTGDIVPSSSTNEKVNPGLVSWHKDFQTALAAAQVSGKPVLLFQMMGYLDDRFC